MTHDPAARATLSEMTDITERTIDEAWHSGRELAALYRDVPSAFWLAPDADLTIQPSEGPALPASFVAQPHAPEPPRAIQGRSKGSFAALCAAGPMFAGISLAIAGGTPGEPWWRPFGRMMASLVAFPLTILVGALLGLIPILFGTLLLSEGGAQRRWLRRPDVWMGTGALLGLAIAALFEVPGSIGISLVATSMLCAGIARHAVTWTEPEFA